MYILINNKNEILAYSNDFVLYPDRVDIINANNDIEVSVKDYNGKTTTKIEVPENFQLPLDFIPRKYLYIQNTILPNVPYTQRHYSVKNEATALMYQFMPEEFRERLLDLYISSFLDNLLFLKTKNLLPENIARAMDIKDIVSGETIGSDGEPIILSEDDITNQNILHNLIFKLRARYKIELEVGDPYDLIADVDKQLQVLTAFIVRLYLFVTTNLEIPTEIKANYDTFAQTFVGAIDSGQYIDRSDLEDAMILIMTLMEKNVKKAVIVRDEYFIKKKE